MQIAIEIPDQIVSDMIITAAEQGIGYWASQTKLFDNELLANEVRKFGDHPIYDLSSIVIVEDEGVNGETEHTLKFSSLVMSRDHRVRDWSQLIHGLSVMAEKYPHHFANVVADNHDAETADVFIQCCLFDEIVYS